MLCRKRNKRPKFIRTVEKNGLLNYELRGIPSKRRRQYADIFYTLMESQWRWILVLFFLGFVGTWLFFGVIYWGISYHHGDFEYAKNNSYKNEEGFSPCIQNVFDFTSILLFSIETQHTIGYGFRYITRHCEVVITIMHFQVILGLLMQVIVTGLIFSKFTKPKKRRSTIVFTHFATINEGENGNLYFSFQLGNIRRAQLLSPELKVFFLQYNSTNIYSTTKTKLEERISNQWYRNRKSPSKSQGNGSIPTTTTSSSDSVSFSPTGKKVKRNQVTPSPMLSPETVLDRSATLPSRRFSFSKSNDKESDSEDESVQSVPVKVTEIKCRCSGATHLFSMYPLLVEHEVNEDSPFYEMKEEDFSEEVETKNNMFLAEKYTRLPNFEIVVMLTGNTETNGSAVELRTSYLPHEIKWANRFLSPTMLIDKKNNYNFSFDLENFEKMIEQKKMKNRSAKEKSNESIKINNHFMKMVKSYDQG
ncbi:hypothetical protein SNEBB_004339 [Seison nebaliae]|nr:hypothetical protein SNEBB_004339 [Seison nebaliae]